MLFEIEISCVSCPALRLKRDFDFINLKSCFISNDSTFSSKSFYNSVAPSTSTVALLFNTSTKPLSIEKCVVFVLSRNTFRFPFPKAIQIENQVCCWFIFPRLRFLTDIDNKKAYKFVAHIQLIQQQLKVFSFRAPNLIATNVS